MKNLVCVVIPVHASNPSKNELISFKQCFKILNKYPIFVLAPTNLNLETYLEAYPTLNIIRIESKWQSSITNYNKLKLSKYFYSLFADYEFLLTYELDSFVFKDELKQWCEKGFDYIGAPWFEGYTNPTKNIIGVGNSGFSLRKIKSIKRNLSKVIYHQPVKGQKRSYLNKFYIILQKNFGTFFYENLTIQKSNTLFEDHVISVIITQIDECFKVAPIHDAIFFSFEANPKHLYELTKQTLPFGCHAWERYDFDFWRQHINHLNEQ